MSPEEGTLGIRIAREAVANGLEHPGADPAARFRSRTLPAIFDERRGLFVTFSTHPQGALRGCVGFPYPVLPLRLAIPRAAWSAAAEDPRFAPIERTELGHLSIELSILTPPEPIGRPFDPGKEVVVGRDGLIVERGEESGLLLPQVAVEERWSSARFLSETCRKAGLPADAWRAEGTTVRRFRAELFRELAPAGAVEPHSLTT